MSMTLWRISEHADLSGAGGKVGSGRWHLLGRPIVYLAESPAGAMLERLVHLIDNEGGTLPRSYQLLEVWVPGGLEMSTLDISFRGDWRDHPEFTQARGTAWLQAGMTPLARVPSAIVPRTWNCLLNPEHHGAAQIKIVSQSRERFDNRLFRFGPR
jgi:RES domain-containing protein